MPTKKRCPVGLASAVTMPTTWPCRFSNGPPELPGLTAASNWISPSSSPLPSSRPMRAIESRHDARRSSSRRDRAGCRPSTCRRRPARRRRGPRGRSRSGSSIGLQHGDVLLRCRRDHVAGRRRAVGEGDLDARGALDHVERGHDLALSVHDHTAPERRAPRRPDPPANGSRPATAGWCGRPSWQPGAPACSTWTRSSARPLRVSSDDDDPSITAYAPTATTAASSAVAKGRSHPRAGARVALGRRCRWFRRHGSCRRRSAERVGRFEAPGASLRTGSSVTIHGDACFL